MSRGSRFFLILVIACLTIAAKKRPRTGKLVINSLNMGAEVFIDGKQRGTIPLRRPLRLRVGKHTVRISQLGHADFLDTVRIRRNRKTNVDVSLVAVSGILVIRGEPEGAEVLIDGRIQGQLPFRDVVDPGRHVLEIRAIDYTTHRANLFVDAGEETPLTVRLIYAPRAPPVAVEKWYENQWVWFGTAGVLLTAAIVTAVVVTDAEDPATNRPTIYLETVR